MHPRTLISYVDKLEEIFIQASFLTGGSEEGLMGSRSAGSYYNPVQLVFFDASFDCRDSFLRASK